MYPGPYQAVMGCRFQELKFDMISNNLANAATSGFKKDIVTFDQTLLQARKTTNFSQGGLRSTGNPLDIALDGEGFFKVRTSGGTRYTRGGSFVLDAEGNLTTQNGDRVQGESGPITIQGTEINIDITGGIQVDGSQLDNLAVVSFSNPGLLQKEGHSYFIYTGDDGEASKPEGTSIMQGHVELSNVEVAEEMIRMIEALRTFESYQKVLQAFDEADGKLVNEVGRFR